MKNPKLKKVKCGEYIYDGRFRISDFGYSRIYGRTRWDVSLVSNCRPIFESDTLREAVDWIGKYEGGAE